MDAEELDELPEDAEAEDSLDAELQAAEAALEARQEQLEELEDRYADAEAERTRLEQALLEQRREDRQLESDVDRCEEELEQTLDRREQAEQTLDRSQYEALLADEAVRQARDKAQLQQETPLAALCAALRDSRLALEERRSRLGEVSERLQEAALEQIDLRAELKAQLRIGRARTRQLGQLRRLIEALETGNAHTSLELDERRAQLLADLRLHQRELAVRRTLARQREAEIRQLEQRLQAQMEQMLS